MRSVGMLALALLGGCYSSPPKFYYEACENETAVRRHETPAPAGLTMPDGLLSELKVLAYSGAAWLEHDVHPMPSLPQAVYTEGAGRYRVWLAHIGEPTCRQALRDEGIDPDTRHPVPRKPDAPFRGADAACLKAERLGDPVEVETRRDWPVAELFKGWSAPYLLIDIAERDPRSEPDDPVWRSGFRVIGRDTLQPIFEAPSLSYWPKTNWFPALNYCGAELPGFGNSEPVLRGVFDLEDALAEEPAKP